MANLFKNLFSRKNTDSPSYRREAAKKLNGRAIKYVTERKEDVDLVIGHSGALIVKEDELIVFSDSDVVFRAKLDQLRSSELLSLEGVILTAPDIEHGGADRTVIAYYTYYLKTRPR